MDHNKAVVVMAFALLALGAASPSAQTAPHAGELLGGRLASVKSTDEGYIVFDARPSGQSAPISFDAESMGRWLTAAWQLVDHAPALDARGEIELPAVRIEAQRGYRQPQRMVLKRYVSAAGSRYSLEVSDGQSTHAGGFAREDDVLVFLEYLERRVSETARSSAGNDPRAVLLEFQVEKPVVPFPNNPKPRYPPSLEGVGLEGEVLVQFVVDTTGRAVMSTFKVLKASDFLFAEAVRDVLPSMRFHPASLNGTKRSQLVQAPFGFSRSRNMESWRP